MATDILYPVQKPKEWRYFHCISCWTVWRDDCDGDRAPHVVMPCPTCGISCGDIPREEALEYIPLHKKRRTIMDTGKNELSPEMVEAIRNVVKEEIGNVIVKQHPFFGMLESEKIFVEEQGRLHEHPLKGVLGRITKVSRTEDGQKFGIKLNEKGREFVNDIYKKQRFDRDDIGGLTNWDEIWDQIVKEENYEND